MDELKKFSGTEGTDEGKEVDELKAFAEGASEGSEVTKGKGKGKAKGEKKPKKEKVKKEPKPRRDNIAFVQGLKNIESVRKFHQVAVAKKAKSADRPEAIERYQKEIDASKEHLAQLLEEAMNADTPLEKLIELGEEPNKVITAFIKTKEAEFVKWVETNEFKVPKNVLKNIDDGVPAEFLNELPLDLAEPVAERHSKSDFRLRAICRKFNFITLVEAGRLQNVEGKWLKEGEELPKPKKVENKDEVKDAPSPEKVGFEE